MKGYKECGRLKKQVVATGQLWEEKEISPKHENLGTLVAQTIIEDNKKKNAELEIRTMFQISMEQSVEPVEDAKETINILTASLTEQTKEKSEEIIRNGDKALKQKSVVVRKEEIEKLGDELQDEMTRNGKVARKRIHSHQIGG